MEFFKWGQKQIRQFALNLTETEFRTEEATNNEPWGPHGSEMSKLAQEANQPDKYREMMGVIAQRLSSKDENWRQVYKALLLLEHLIKHGPIRVALDIQASVEFLNRLQCFEYKDKTGQDFGMNVRNRAKELADLVLNEDRLEEAREKARINRGKYKGASKTDVRFKKTPSKSISSYEYIAPKRVILEDKEETDVDPFEATKKRIENLKVTEKEEAPTMKRTIPLKKEPKRLSQVKVNPEIAATFVKLSNNVSTLTTAAKPTVDLLSELEDNFNSTESTHSASSLLPEDTSNDEWADFVSNEGKLHPPMHDLVCCSGLVPQKQDAVDPFEDIFTQMDSSSSNQIGAVKDPLDSTFVNGFMLDDAFWTTPMQSMSDPNVKGQLDGFFQLNDRAIAQGPGAPMNPKAVRQQLTQKDDPFAGLGLS